MRIQSSPAAERLEHDVRTSTTPWLSDDSTGAVAFAGGIGAQSGAFDGDIGRLEVPGQGAVIFESW